MCTVFISVLFSSHLPVRQLVSEPRQCRGLLVKWCQSFVSNVSKYRDPVCFLYRGHQCYHYFPRDVSSVWNGDHWSKFKKVISNSGEKIEKTKKTSSSSRSGFVRTGYVIAALVPVLVCLTCWISLQPGLHVFSVFPMAYMLAQVGSFTPGLASIWVLPVRNSLSTTAGSERDILLITNVAS